MSDIYLDEKGNMSPVEPVNKRTYSLEELQTKVCGPIELIDLDKYYLVVNEEGKLRHMRVNLVATSWYFLATGRNEDIVGPVLLVGKETIG